MKRYEKKIEISNGVECIFQTPLFTGDIGNTIGLEFYLHGKPYKFKMATLFGTDATGDTIYSTSKAEVNEVVLPIVNEMYQVPGKADMQVVLYDDSENAITSAYLHFTVIKGLSENASIAGTEEYNSIMNLLVQVSSSMSQINRAERAANEIESFLQLIKTPENSVIHQITESEIDGFSEGYAIVTAIESEDSEGGPIVTEYHYPLIAERVDLFGNVRINQIRFYNGILQQRMVGEEWVDFTGGSVVTDALTYKGSLESTSFLPSDPSTGDMYNIETESNITVKGEEKTKYLIPCSGSIDSIGEFYSQYDAMYDSWLNQPSVLELFDNDGNSLGIGSSVICFDGTVLVQGSGLEEGTQISYIQLPNQADNENALGEAVTVYETIEIPVMPKQKVFYNGKEWDVFTDIGNVETALDSIIAIENALIGGDSV